MTRLTKLHRLLIGTACVFALSACSTVAVKPPEKLPLDQVMGQAADASRDGKKEQALKLLQQASTDYPTEKAPWVQKAQIRFEGGQYGEAILDAQQALARDPTEQLANSIVAISGLRLSTTALSELSRQNNLSGSLRSESQDLARLLRESIGEAVLVPPVKPKAPQRVATGKSAPPAKVTSDGADPFGALK